MKVIVYAVTGLLCLALAAGAFLFVAAPTADIERQLIAAFKAKTGRDLVVRGDTSLSLYPSLGIELGDVTISGLPETDGEPFASIGVLRVKVPLWPLLQRQLVVDEFVLDRPAFVFAIEADGRRNWEFRRTSEGDADTEVSPDEAAEPVVDGTEADAPPTLGQSPGLGGLTLKNIRINSGSFEIVDRRSGSRDAVSEVDLRFELSDFNSPLSAAGSLVWRQRRVPLSVTLGSPAELLAGKATSLVFSSQSDLLAISFDGKMELQPKFRLTGSTKAVAPSLRQLLSSFGSPPPAIGGLGELAIEGGVVATDAGMAFTDASIRLDGWRARGKFSAAQANGRPKIVAVLSVDQLDLNTYLSGTVDEAGSASAADTDERPVEATGEAASSPDPEAGEDAGGWSREPIDLTMLTTFDATAKLTLGELTYRKIKLDQSAVSARLERGVLTAKFDQVALYSGEGTGTLSIDARQKSTRVALEADLKAIQSQPLLTDAVGIDWLAGAGSLAFSLEATGDSIRSMISTLAGTGRLSFRDGAIVGFNLPQMIRGLEQGRLEGWKGGATAKTDFSELDGSFEVGAGIVDNRDLRLTGPLLRLSGSGTIDLPGRLLNYLAKPKLVASLEGQGGDAALTGIEIPVRVTGPWRKPKFMPDLAAVLKDPKATAEAAKKIGETLKNDKGVKKLIEKLGDKKTQDKINKALGDLLGNGD